MSTTGFYVDTADPERDRNGVLSNVEGKMTPQNGAIGASVDSPSAPGFALPGPQGKVNGTEGLPPSILRGERGISSPGNGKEDASRKEDVPAPVAPEESKVSSHW